LVPQIVKDKKVTVTSVLIFDPKTDAIDKKSIKSTAHFIKLLRAELLQTSEHKAVNDLNLVLVALIEAKAQYGQLSIPDNNYQALEGHPGWNSFFEENFELAVKAKTFFLGL